MTDIRQNFRQAKEKVKEPVKSFGPEGIQTQGVFTPRVNQQSFKVDIFDRYTTVTLIGNFISNSIDMAKGDCTLALLSISVIMAFIRNTCMVSHNIKK